MTTADPHESPDAAAAVADGSMADLHPTMSLPEAAFSKVEIDMPSDHATQMVAGEPAGAFDRIPGYEISAAIGRGAMGVVYRARQVKLQRLVALKVLVGRSHASAADVARFNSEAVTIAQIQHPNVMQIFDVGEHAGCAYLAAEYVDGGTLETKMNAGRISIPETIRLVYQIARGVGAAHSKGVVHRDLKPSNILLTADGVPKVADFGLAKQLGPENATMTGSVMGTPAYMAPEQAAGQNRRIGPQTDVYALGVILYQCLTGEVPLKGDSLLETLERIRDVEPPSVRELRADIPQELEEICERCLKKVPADRYPTADALAEALGVVAAQWETVRTHTSGPVKRAPAKPAPPTGAREPNYVVPTVVAGIGLLFIVALFGYREFGWFKRGGGPTIIQYNAPATPPAQPNMGDFSAPPQP